jgi:hypothetical protein
MILLRRIGIAYMLGLALLFLVAAITDLSTEAVKAMILLYGVWFIGIGPAVWFLWGLHMIFTCAHAHRESLRVSL